LRISIGNHQELQGGLARPAHLLFPTLDRVRAHVQQPRKLRLAGIERNPDPLDAASGMLLAGARSDYYY